MAKQKKLAIASSTHTSKLPTVMTDAFPNMKIVPGIDFKISATVDRAWPYYQ